MTVRRMQMFVCHGRELERYDKEWYA